MRTKTEREQHAHLETLLERQKFWTAHDAQVLEAAKPPKPAEAGFGRRATADDAARGITHDQYYGDPHYGDEEV